MHYYSRRRLVQEHNLPPDAQNNTGAGRLISAGCSGVFIFCIFAVSFPLLFFAMFQDAFSMHLLREG